MARLHLDVAFALYQARERAGVSVEQLAERAGLTPERVLMIEEGDTTSLTEVVLICDALALPVAGLFSESTAGDARQGAVTRVA
jgi:transcriptional regulator with XRE-family HTH domain